MKKFLHTMFMFSVGAGLYAQVPNLVKDINLKKTSPGISNLVEINGKAYFTATTAAYGNELWISDGTVAGTVMVKDINPGTTGSSIANMANMNGVLYFKATNGTNGDELWKSDGTEAGTVMVKDINSGFSGSTPNNFTYMGSVVYFTATDSTNGMELWKTDGTSGGTQLVMDIYPGVNGSSQPNNSSPASLTVVGSTLYFTATTASGTELWKTDGTTTNTMMVKDINTDTASASSSPTLLTNVGGVLYFSAIGSAAAGTELWKSDGTSAGTVQVKDITPTANTSTPLSNFYSVNNKLIFNANNGTTGTNNGNEFWISDGTDAGTMMIVDLVIGTSGIVPTDFVVVGNLLYCSLDGSDGFGKEIWKTDGTAAGTVRVTDINPGTASSNPANLVYIDNTLYFNASGSATPINYGKELWKSDGTAVGTMMLMDINVGSGDSAATKLTASKYFLADNGLVGSQLWKTDGTIAGTAMVKEVFNVTAASAPDNFLQIGDTLYFSANDGINGRELWRSDSNGTTMVKDINGTSADSGLGNFVNVNGTLYFTATNAAAGNELWKSDGTAAGTVLVKDIYPGGTGSAPGSLTAVGNTLYFSATVQGATAPGRELWKSDGTDAGTVLVKDINSTSYNQNSNPANLKRVGNLLYFSAANGVNGTELWQTDGTLTGTVMVKDINPTGDSNPSNLTELNGILYFSALDNATNGVELWKSDGTPSGTTMVLNIAPANNVGGSPTNIVAMNNNLYFSASDGTNAVELWKSDGTAANTVMLKDINPAAGSSSPANLTVTNGNLFFTANDGTNGTELWASDGTAANTRMVKDINAGATSTTMSYLTAVGSTLYFAANEPVNGNELWSSDGTTANTKLVANINTTNAGIGNADPKYLTNVNGRLYFQANDNVLNAELYVVVTAPPTTASQTLCAGSKIANLTASGSNLQWYAALTGGSALASDTVLTATNYYVSQTLNGTEGPRNTVAVTLTTPATPSFSSVPTSICKGTALTLPTSSTDATAITGTWTPVVDNNATATYTFTPTVGLCANVVTATVTVNDYVTPTFTSVPASICKGAALTLPTSSSNTTVITGTWAPAADNNVTTTYTFTPTPTAGLCANPTTKLVTVNEYVASTFTQIDPICTGTALTLPTSSTNSPAITGTWAPALNNTATTEYTFTPTTGLCANPATMTIAVIQKTTPVFAPVAAICAGTTLTALPTTASGIAGTWAPALNNTATTEYTFTPDANQCANPKTMTIIVNQKTAPIFSPVGTICTGTTLTALPTTASGITGTWAPELNNTATTEYTFTPDAGQCAISAIMTITVNQKTTPAFTPVAAICTGTTLTALPTTASGITGTWAPELNNTATTDYTFTPDANQCANSATMTITVNQKTTPVFTPVTICTGTTLTALPTTASGITGTWTPELNNTATTDYTFTPDAGQCAISATMTITVNQKETPAFSAIAPLCNGATAPELLMTSSNNIAGTWAPATVNNTVTTDYTFTPAVGVCASDAHLTIEVLAVVPAPTGEVHQTIEQGKTVKDLVIEKDPNGVITWYDSEPSGSSKAAAFSESDVLVTGKYYAVQTVGGCTSAPFVVTVDLELGVNQFEIAGLKYYPNPVKEELNVSYNHAIDSIEMFNLLGQQIKSIRPNATSTKIDMAGLPMGAYLLQVNSQGNSTMIKVVKD